VSDPPPSQRRRRRRGIARRCWRAQQQRPAGCRRGERHEKRMQSERTGAEHAAAAAAAAAATAAERGGDDGVPPRPTSAHPSHPAPRQMACRQRTQAARPGRRRAWWARRAVAQKSFAQRSSCCCFAPQQHAPPKGMRRPKSRGAQRRARRVRVCVRSRARLSEAVAAVLGGLSFGGRSAPSPAPRGASSQHKRARCTRRQPHRRLAGRPLARAFFLGPKRAPSAATATALRRTACAAPQRAAAERSKRRPHRSRWPSASSSAQPHRPSFIVRAPGSSAAAPAAV